MTPLVIWSLVKQLGMPVFQEGVAFVNEDSVQFFTVCEQKGLCKATSLQVALFLMFSAYYGFNLEYLKRVRNVLFFTKDYILSQPDSFKRPSPYISVVSDIKRSML